MLSKEYIMKRQRYYKNVAVQFELLKAMKDREVIFMDRNENWKCIRGLFFSTISGLQKGFHIFNFLEKDYNIYISVAKYRFIPPFTADLTKRSKETSEWFQIKAEKQQYDYDLLFDFDNRYRKKINDKWDWIVDRPEMLKNIEFLIKEVIPYNLEFYIIPSGTNFQIIIKNKNKISKERIKILFRTLKKKYSPNLDFLDMSGIGHRFKIMKCPYSCSGQIVCLPIDLLTKESISYYYQYDINNVLKEITLYQRGIKLHNGGLYEKSIIL